MEPEQRLEKLEQQMLAQRAVLLTQSAEISALLTLLRSLDTSSKLESGRAAQPEVFDQAFLAVRATMLRQLLLQIEQTDPALAARLGEALERPGLQFPLQWERD